MGKRYTIVMDTYEVRVELKSGKETFVEVSIPSDTEQMDIKTYIESGVANAVNDVKSIIAFRRK